METCLTQAERVGDVTDSNVNERVSRGADVGPSRLKPRVGWTSDMGKMGDRQVSCTAFLVGYPALDTILHLHSVLSKDQAELGGRADM